MSDLAVPTQTVVATHVLSGSGSITYNLALRVRFRAPLKTYNGGTVVQTYVKKNSTPTTDNVEIVKLAVSNPTATFFLNSGLSGSPSGCVFKDYMLVVPAKGGSTLTLTIDTIDSKVPAELVIGEDSIVSPEDDTFDDFQGVFVQINHQPEYVSTTITNQMGGGIRGFKFGGFSEDVLTNGAEK